MAAYAYDDQLLIHVFQDSLVGVALNWYTHLEPSRIHCWADLADAFVKRYIYNTHVAPDRLQLQNMGKKDNETFKEYAQRWRELATQVEPPLFEKEMVAMFVNTLQPPFYEYMVGNVSANFADVVIIGERIEIGMKSGKIASGPSTMENSKKKPSFNPELLPHLIKRGLVAVCPMIPLQPPYPRGYDADAKCSYHGDGTGHSTERCMAFKRKVQALIDAGWLKFQEDKPSIDTNPLSGYGNASTNAIEIKKHELIRDASKIRSSRRFIFKELLKLGFLNGDYDLERACGLHPCTEHSIEECVEFERFLQNLLDRNLMQVCYEDKYEDVFAQTGMEPNVALPEPLIIRFTRTTPTPVIQGRSPFVIHAPVPFPYKSDKVVPWRYGTHVVDEGQCIESHSSSQDPVVENISGIGGMTRSGRIFTPPNLTGREASNNETSMDANTKEHLKGKGVQVEETSDKADKKQISEEEACEFLKFIQQSEYKVVEQLKRMPARISLLELLMHSTSHRKLLMKVLSEAHVEHGISLNKFEGIVGNIIANNYLTFTDEEIPTEGRGHNKALHVSVKCLDHIIARVLVDNGSSLNVMPKSTLEKLPCDGMHMKPSSMIVRAFDGSKRVVMGEIELPVQVGPCVFQVTFQVMDILPAYSCLLGRPWIHSAGVVPSTLHQKLKYVMGDKLVIISGEEDLLVSGPSSTRYIEAAEEALETAFQSLEIVGNTYVEPFSMNPHLSCTSIMAAKVMLKEGYKYGNGLGKYGQGRTFPLEMIGNKNRYGLGYRPNKEDDKRLIEERKKCSLARMGKWEPRAKKIHICGIKESFRSAGWVNASHIAAVEDEDSSECSSFVRACSPATPLNNWETLSLPVMLNNSKKCRYDNESFENNNVDIPNFEHPIDNTEDDYEDDPEPSPELLRLVEQESKEIKPHQEDVEVLNLGEEGEIKEVKVDMPGLDTDIVQHKLPLKQECLPVKQRLRRMKPEMSLKKDGKVRMCVDYRDLNRASPKDNFPLPHIDTLVDNTAKYSLFSFMDGFSGYNQIKMAPEDMEKTTFITLWGTFCYKVMSFGLKNAGATYQRAMVTLFHDMMHKEIEVYVDDMIAKSESEEEHVLNLKKLFERLRKYKLRLNPAKCTFGVKSGKLLGFVVSQKGIEVDPDKVRAISEMPAPSTEKEVRGFLGRLNYIARFISQLTATCEPMFKLLRKNQVMVWNEDCQAAFERIKQYLKDPPVLRPPEPGKPLILYLTVLERSMGCVLGQYDEAGKREHAIYYLSKKFTDCEQRYSSLERTCCALAWKSVKGSALAEYLAHQPISDYQPMQPEFPDEDIMALFKEGRKYRDEETWILLFDGASNMMGHGIGAVLISPEQQYMPMTSRLCFDCTNNIAEYELKEEWETRDAKLIPYQAYIKGLMECFDIITFNHIPREDNQLADALATLSSMFEVDPNTELPVIEMKSHTEPAYCQFIKEEVDGKPWYFDIKHYLKTQEYPEKASENDKRSLRRLAGSFILSGDILYKRNHDMILLRCVDTKEAELILKEVHEGTFGTHMNGHSMARKILRAGYFWLTMENDCCTHVRRCEKCQMHADNINVSPTTLNVLSAPWPFSMWGIDVIGAIEPKASNGHRFILVAIDYFTKWVEAVSYANVTRKVVTRFIKRELICRYGLPNKIITDNATNLNNRMMAELCEEFKIHHLNSSPYRPKMNGAVEAANKNIKKIVQKMVVTYNDWHEMLPFALHGYRTSVRTSTGATPFSLVYGMEAVLPFEVEIPSLRILLETQLEEAEWVQARFDQLNLIEEKRLTAVCHGQLYQRRMKKAFDKKVHPRDFHEGELVLKKILPIQRDFRGKWTPNYEGPFVVKRAFSGGALILTRMDGEELPLPVNSDAVKKFYA
ncbi:RNA-directed DNA polymerase-like protein [Vigna angularis]|uniref:RNA-directed DNA polymerase-like protein n=1 Tax=Phaseolus angularis TaxID=3914 RepID=A0A8T0K5K1_PHAAN|nr:RNA-directed DNA polymerase-like protein [Vigna angularis]